MQCTLKPDLALIAKVKYSRTDPGYGNRKRFACNLTVAPKGVRTQDAVVDAERRAREIFRRGDYRPAEPDMYMHVSEDEELEPPTTRVAIYVYAKDELDAACLAAGYVALLEQEGISWVSVPES